MRFRIKKITLANETVYYIIQKTWRPLWIGPEVWVSYSGDYETSWCIFQSNADVFYDLNYAEEILSRLVHEANGFKVNEEIVKEY